VTITGARFRVTSTKGGTTTAAGATARDSRTVVPLSAPLSGLKEI
jgi:hypothetical protein